MRRARRVRREPSFGLAEFAPWDIAYASEKLKAARYAYNEQDVRQYFPEDQRAGRPLPRGGDDLRRRDPRGEGRGLASRRCASSRSATASGALVGEFYFDLYARAGKQGGAWMDDAINRRACAATLQHPVAYLTCNLSAPVGGKPATFTHEEVITIFHEFGHGLHQLLTTRRRPRRFRHCRAWNGTRSSCPRSSWRTSAGSGTCLRDMTRHVDTGEPLPRELFDRMLAAKNFQSGMATVRQLEMGLFDMRAARANTSRRQAALADRRRRCSTRCGARSPSCRARRTTASSSRSRTYSPAATPRATTATSGPRCCRRTPSACSRSRACCRRTCGCRFRDEVLARGGSRPAMESFVAFRGRPPQLDALLRHNGMIESVVSGRHK